MPAGLQALIISMPPDATFLDTQMAENVQKLMHFKHQIPAQIFFIRYEDKELVLQHLFEGKGSDHHQVEGMRIKNVSLEPDTMIYSWGNAKNGKLGISDNYTQDFDDDKLNQFYIDDNLEQNQDDFDYYKEIIMNAEDGTEKKDHATLMENIYNFMEFEQKIIFTPKPQCIVGLMGVKASKIECGKNHVLLLTQDS